MNFSERLKARMDALGLRATDISEFLMGKVSASGGNPFRCNFDWLIAPSNFVKVVEGNYNA